MNNFQNQDDDIAFNPTTSSNLASLFGTSMNLQKSAEINLSYTAPKQPKANQSTESSNLAKQETQSSVVCSKVVDVYKLEKNIPIFEGKCGIAVIGCQSVNVYEIILYKSKQETFARSRLRPDFLFIIEANNFVYFCDDQKLRWCIHFKTPQDLKEFSQNIHDYNGKIIYNNEVNQVQSNTLNEPEIKSKMELANTPVPAFPIQEQLESDATGAMSSNVTKANILSRMAKMGQSILPNTQNFFTQNDAEIEELKNKEQMKTEEKLVKHDVSYDKFKNIKSKIAPSSLPESILPNDNLIPLSVHTQNPINYKLIQQSFPNQVMWNQPQIMALPDPLNLFISESRIHNCEIRMNINQLSSKLDQVLFKLGNGSNNNVDVPSIVDQQKQETNQLLDYFKEEIKKQTEINAQSNKMDHDIESNFKIISEQTEKINQLQEENIALKAKLNLKEETERNIQELQCTIDKQQISLQTLQTFYDQHKEQNIDNQKIFELNEVIANLKTELNCINMKTDQFENKIKQSMSILYQQIIESFNDENKLEANINTIIAKFIKNSTFTIIKNFQLDFQNSESNSSQNSA